MSKKIYIIAHTWRDTEMRIETFSTPEKCVRRISEILSDDWNEKADPTDDPQEFLDRFNDRDEDERGECNVYLSLKIQNV